MSRRTNKNLHEVSPKHEEVSPSPAYQSIVGAFNLSMRENSEEQDSLFVSENEGFLSSEVGDRNALEENNDVMYEQGTEVKAEPQVILPQMNPPLSVSSVGSKASGARPSAKKVGKYAHQEHFIKRKRQSTERTKMKWTTVADRKLLMFALGREVTPAHYGEIANSFPEKPTRRAIGERLVKLRKEQLALLEKYEMTAPEADIYDEDGNVIDFTTERPTQSRKRPREIPNHGVNEEDDDNDVVIIDDSDPVPVPPNKGKGKMRESKRPRTTVSSARVPELTVAEMPSQQVAHSLSELTALSAREAVIPAQALERHIMPPRPPPALVNMERPGRFSLESIPSGYEIFEESRRGSSSTSASTRRPAPSSIRPITSQVAIQDQSQSQDHLSHGSNEPSSGGFWRAGRGGIYRGSGGSSRNLGPRGGSGDGGYGGQLGPRGGSLGPRGGSLGPRGGSLGPRGGSFGSKR